MSPGSLLDWQRPELPVSTGLGYRISLLLCHPPLAPAWGGLRELTFTLPPFPFVARFAETFVRLGCVLADGIYVTVICAL